MKISFFCYKSKYESSENLLDLKIKSILVLFQVVFVVAYLSSCHTAASDHRLCISRLETDSFVFLFFTVYFPRICRFVQSA